MKIRPADAADLPAFFAYLDDHLRDNGRDGAPLFQPPPVPAMRAHSPLPPGLRIAFIKGLDMPVGEPGWRRLWLALDGRGSIAGHVDLRARPEPSARHRTMLGMGVHRAYRRRGLGLAGLHCHLIGAGGSRSSMDRPRSPVRKRAGFRNLPARWIHDHRPDREM